MVEDRVTDGRRIAQLLASELTGLETGPLAAVSVVDADPDVEPTADGALAYRIDHRQRRVGSVFVFPDRADVRLDLAGADVSVEIPSERTDEGVVFAVESGVAVKRAVDGVRAVLARDA